ncbi:MAG: dTMP kinase [Gammaproteobacteria bacterium]|nr:dTMP kinase [Gammaproteobacteria bacterium]
MKGKFITVEGIEGVGKSTNIDFLSGLIESAGHPVLRTREPGGTPMAESIRDMLLEHGHEPVPDVAELLLFFAARSLHLQNRIRPALERGEWVVCDRFTDASRAYQGNGRGLDMTMIDTLAAWVQNGLEPDLTILLDASAELGMARAGARGGTDRLESEQVAFYTRVREGYLSLASAHPERFCVVDASQPIDVVQASIRQTMAGFLNNKLDHKK